MSSRAWPDIAGRIDGGVHKLPIRVYYEDTDFSGIVYHANYLKFAERGRSDFLRLADVHHSDLIDADQPLAFAVHKMEVEFIQSARIDDVLEVHTRYLAARGARLAIDQGILRDDKTIWRAHVAVACIDMQGRPRRMPKHVQAALAQLVTRHPV